MTNWAAVMIWTGGILFVLMLLPPGRAVLSFAGGQAWTLLTWLGAVILNAAQAAGMSILRAHGVILKNLFPRVMVLPSVGKKTTRR